VDTKKLTIDFDGENSGDEVNRILNFGVDVQKQVADIANLLVDAADRVEVEEVTEVLQQTMSQLQNTDGILQKDSKLQMGKKAEKLTAQNAVEELLAMVEQLESTLDQYRVDMLMNMEMYRYLQEMSSGLSEQLIEKIKYAEAWRTELQQNKKEASGNAAKNISYLERRMEQLRITGEIARQQTVQAQMLRSTTADMLSQLQTILFHVIPLWKNNMSSEIFLTNNVGAMEEVIQKNNQMLLGGLGDIKNVQKETLHRSSEISVRKQ